MTKRVSSVFLSVFFLLLCGCSSISGAQSQPISSQGPSSGPFAEPTSTPELAPADSTPSAVPSANKLSKREEKWVEDLEYLREQYEALHPVPFRYVSEEEFDFQLEQLKKKISKLSDNDMSFEIKKIIAGFCDTHTVANGPASVYERVFPFDVIVLGEKVYLYLYDKDYSELLEPYFLREIVAVNGVDIGYIRQKASELYYPTNFWFNKEVLSYSFYLPAFMDWVGCDHQEGYTFHILNEDDQVELVELPAVPVDGITYDCYPKDFVLPNSFLNPDANRAEYIEDERGGYVYILFSHMETGDMKAYEDFFSTATELLKEHPGCKLVIDLRKNSGGHSNVQSFARQKALEWRELPIEKTYTLTGGFMMSAAIDLRTVFKEGLDGIAVGEPTGQFFGTFGNSKDPRQVIYLPNSQISVFIADMWWPGLHPEQYTRNENSIPYEWQNTVLPDVYVSLDAKDFRQGRDSILEWVLEH